jgi:patatin-like phospholipase/acyl hydrolase
VRIWLSGAVPDDAAADERERIRDFVRIFAREAFARGGTIVHGSHPTIRDVLLDEAQASHTRSSSKAPLRLVVSDFFAKTPDRFGIDIPAWEEVCAESVTVTPAVPLDASGESRARDRSLSVMRRALADQSHVIVAVGGLWWREAPGRAGVPEEVEIARDYQLPLFLLGGLGGATAGYLAKHPEYVDICRNGLTVAANVELVRETDPSRLVAEVLGQIGRLIAGVAVSPRTGPHGGPLRVAAQARGVGIGEPAAGQLRRILCLDGGGIRGAFTAKVLADWETMTGERIIDHFDLIAGTSTGGILAIGLGMGMTPADMVEFYKSEGPTIFPGGGFWGKALEIQQWFAAKFDRAVLRNRLEVAFRMAPEKSPLLAASKVRLAITAYDAETDIPRVYRTPHSEAGRLDRNRDRLDVAMATSAAPTYFDPSRIGNVLGVDGGVWANSPTTVALAEAAQLRWNIADVRILSVGTLYTPNVLAQPFEVDDGLVKTALKPLIGSLGATAAGMFWKNVSVQGKLGWLPTIANLLMKTQVQTADHVCRSLLGSRYLRVDMATPEIPMDDAKAIYSLVGYGEAAALQYVERVRNEFLVPGSRAEPWSADGAK